MIQLMIKGDVRVAIAALEKRQIEPIAGSFKTHNDVMLVMVRDGDWKKVSDWFGEPGTAPYPPGSLLHYQLDCRENT